MFTYICVEAHIYNNYNQRAVFVYFNAYKKYNRNEGEFLYFTAYKEKGRIKKIRGTRMEDVWSVSTFSYQIQKSKLLAISTFYQTKSLKFEGQNLFNLIRKLKTYP